MIGAAVCTVACAIAVTLLVGAERRGDHAGRRRWKPIASAAFIALPIVGGAWAAGDRTMAAWILAGLCAGAVGDVALMFDSERAFLAGLVAFLAGHVAYVVALAHATPMAQWLDGAMVAVVPAVAVTSAAVLAWLWPRLGSMRIPVIGYVLVITAMLIGGAAATVAVPDGARSTARLVLTAGAALFYASDLAVAREKFVVRDPWNRTVGLPVYYAAQCLFGWALIA